MKSILVLDYCKFYQREFTNSSFYIIFADFYYHDTNVWDYLLITSMPFIVPNCLIFGIAPILYKKFKEGLLIE